MIKLQAVGTLARLLFSRKTLSWPFSHLWILLFRMSVNSRYPRRLETGPSARAKPVAICFNFSLGSMGRGHQDPFALAYQLLTGAL